MALQEVYDGLFSTATGATQLYTETLDVELGVAKSADVELDKYAFPVTLRLLVADSGSVSIIGTLRSPAGEAWTVSLTGTGSTADVSSGLVTVTRRDNLLLFHIAQGAMEGTWTVMAEGDQLPAQTTAAVQVTRGGRRPRGPLGTLGAGGGAGSGLC